MPIDFKTMIHEIHTANVVIYGFGGSVVNYDEVTYPMPLANCQACHVDSATAYFAPRAAQNGTTTVLGNTAAENLRTTKWLATCGSCHTAGDAIAHMRGFGGGQNMTQAEIDALNGTQPVPASGPSSLKAKVPGIRPRDPRRKGARRRKAAGSSFTISR